MKGKRITKLLGLASVFLLSIVLLSGCVSVNEKIAVNDNGSGSYGITVKLDKAAMNSLNSTEGTATTTGTSGVKASDGLEVKSIDTSETNKGTVTTESPLNKAELNKAKAKFAKQGIKMTILDNKEYLGYTLTKTFDKPENLNKTAAAVVKALQETNASEQGVGSTPVGSNNKYNLIMKKGLIKNKYSLNSTFKGEESDPSTVSMFDQMFDYTIIAEMPGKIIEHDKKGTVSKDAKTITWKIKGNDISKDLKFSVVSEKDTGMLLILVIGGGAIFLGVIIFVILLFIKKKKNGGVQNSKVPTTPNNFGSVQAPVIPNMNQQGNMFVNPNSPNIYEAPNPPIQQAPQGTINNGATQIPFAPETTDRRMGLIRGTTSVFEGMSIYMKSDNQTFYLENGTVLTLEQVRALHDQGYIQQM